MENSPNTSFTSKISIVIENNLSGDKQESKRTRHLSLEGYMASTKFKPYLTYLHVPIQRTSEQPVKQTFSYVEYTFDMLYDAGLFADFSRLALWSDGCGKHFKTYSTHAYMSHLQSRLRETKEHYVSFILMGSHL